MAAKELEFPKSKVTSPIVGSAATYAFDPGILTKVNGPRVGSSGKDLTWSFDRAPSFATFQAATYPWNPDIRTRTGIPGRCQRCAPLVFSSRNLTATKSLLSSGLKVIVLREPIGPVGGVVCVAFKNRCVFFLAASPLTGSTSKQLSRIMKS